MEELLEAVSGALGDRILETVVHADQLTVRLSRDTLIEDLTTGCISITPYRIGTSSPCGWCDYRPLCRFDWQINDYNILENIGKEEVLERMRT